METRDGFNRFNTPTDGDGVLNVLGLLCDQERQREVAMVLLAVQWVLLNPAPQDDHISDEVLTRGMDGVELTWWELSQRGCPYVDELSIPAFAHAGGMTEYRAENLIREAVMLVYMLPRVWQKAQHGDVDVWRARKLAEECWGLTPEALDYVDNQMSLSKARHTQGGREGVITEAKLRYMADQVAKEEEQNQEKRCVIFDWDTHKNDGLVDLYACLDVADAQALKQALNRGVKALGEQAGDTLLGVRQAWALGDIAQNYLTPSGDAKSGSADNTGTPSTSVGVYLHLTPDAFLDQPRRDQGKEKRQGFSPIRVEGPGIPRGMVLTPQRVREWFNRPTTTGGAKIIFRPVIDLADHHHVEAYEVPNRLKEHVGLRDRGCVFPWCHRQAQQTDCDHIISHSTGGPTCTCNLAPLCRRHHRIKTHADNHHSNPYTWWKHESLGDGQYLWRGPKGSVLLRTNQGVYDLTPPTRVRDEDVDYEVEKALTQIRANLPPPPPPTPPAPPSSPTPPPSKSPPSRPEPDIGPPPF